MWDKGGRWVGLTTLRTWSAVCHRNLGASTSSWPVQACNVTALLWPVQAFGALGTAPLQSTFPWLSPGTYRLPCVRTATGRDFRLDRDCCRVTVTVHLLLCHYNGKELSVEIHTVNHNYITSIVVTMRVLTTTCFGPTCGPSSGCKIRLDQLYYNAWIILGSRGVGGGGIPWSRVVRGVVISSMSSPFIFWRLTTPTVVVPHS